MAETLDRFNSSLWAGQFLPNGQISSSPTGRSVPTQRADQYLTEGSLAEAGIPVPQSVAAPSKITPKTSTVTTPKSGQPEPDSLPFGGQHLKNFSEEEKKEVNRELAVKTEVEVLQDTQQETKDQNFNSQGQNCIFLEANIPAGGGENVDKMPN
jgi:hypothetical protein